MSKSITLKGGVTLFAPVRPKDWPSLGPRYSVRYDNLLTGRDNARGPFRTVDELIRDIEGYAEHNSAFNVYVGGKLVGTTEY